MERIRSCRTTRRDRSMGPPRSPDSKAPSPRGSRGCRHLLRVVDLCPLECGAQDVDRAVVPHRPAGNGCRRSQDPAAEPEFRAFLLRMKNRMGAVPCDSLTRIETEADVLRSTKGLHR